MANVNLFVPVDGKGGDWPRKVANAINVLLIKAKDADTRYAALEARVTSLEARVTDLETP